MESRHSFGTRGTQTAERGLNAQPATQADLIRYQLQRQGLNPPFALVPDGRGGVIAVPVVNPSVPFGVPVGVGNASVGNARAQQKTQQRVNRIRLGR